MPSDLVSLVNLDFAYLPFLERLLEAKAKSRERGSYYFTTELFRSMDRSQALYVTYKRGGPKAAPPGYSGHNFGIASDEALIIQPSPRRRLRWNEKDYNILYEELEKVGLTNGSSYGDFPHVEIPGFVSKKQLVPLKTVWYATDPSAPILDRLKEVWAYLDKHGALK